MHNFAALNSKIINADKAGIQAVSSAVFYGKSVFTTLAVYNSKPFLWEKHWRRLLENSERLTIELKEISEQKIYESLTELIKKNNIKNARARITLIDESPDKIWSYESNKKTSLLITTADFREIPKEFSLTVSPFLVNSASPLAGVKSGNYLENILALRNARKAGFSEAVRINEEGGIVSASMANLFWIDDGKILTPPLKTGALKGTMREFVLENFTASEVEEKIDSLQNADEIFLTSSGIGIVAIAKFDNRILQNTHTLKIQNWFENLLQNGAVNL